MVTKNSGISDKNKLLKFLYKNPDKLAIKLAKFLQGSDGNSLEPVKFKQRGQGYYYSVNDRKLIRVSRDYDFYLLPWEDLNNDKKCYIYTHYNWMVGRILNVYKDDLEFIGFN